MQANLVCYYRPQATWKPVDKRKVTAAAFVYFRDKSIPRKLLDIADDHPEWREEIVMTWYLDEVCGAIPRTTDQVHNVQAWTDRREIWCFEHKYGFHNMVQMKRERLFGMAR